MTSAMRTDCGYPRNIFLLVLQARSSSTSESIQGRGDWIRYPLISAETDIPKLPRWLLLSSAFRPVEVVVTTIEEPFCVRIFNNNAKGKKKENMVFNRNNSFESNRDMMTWLVGKMGDGDGALVSLMDWIYGVGDWWMGGLGFWMKKGGGFGNA